MATPGYAYPTSPVEDAGGPQRLHPNFTADSTKLCMYKAMAGAITGDIGRYPLVVEETKPIRRTFMVPFDDDVWALVLAYLYDFRPKGSYTSYAKATEACSGASKGETLYISIGSSDPNKSGHAIYAVVGEKGVQYYDNENATDRSKIASKFQSGFTFLIFSRSASGAPGRGTLAYKIANMPASLVESLLSAHEAYGHFTIGLQRADRDTRTDIAKRYATRATKAKYALKANAALDKAISDWDTAMPKQT